MNDLEKLIKANPGTCRMSVSIYDRSENIAVKLPSKKVQIKVDKNVMESLDQIKGLKYKLN